ncbi:MAG TPA: rod-binding protein [Mariprofundaceae bacterium]|nr:rod-binding protein [Mariprofundaceae bacterium]
MDRITSLHAGMPLSAQAQRNEAAGANHPSAAKPARDKKLWQASLQFEAVFIQKMLSEMHKSMPKSGLLKSGFAENVHHSMMDQAVAKAASRTDPMGMAASIYRDLQQASQAQVQALPADMKNNPVGKERGDRYGTN